MFGLHIKLTVKGCALSQLRNLPIFLKLLNFPMCMHAKVHNLLIQIHIQKSFIQHNMIIFTIDILIVHVIENNVCT